MKAIDVLEKMWKERIDMMERGETPEKTQQRSNFFYNFLFNCNKAGVKPAKYPTFKYSLIYKLEKKYGYMKEDLNIFSKPDATLYRRFGTEFIVYEHTLYEIIGILATEKSGIAGSLQKYLSKRGIYIVDTQGIQSRYAMSIVRRYIDQGYPAFTMSDYDVSGCFMMKRYEKIGAHRITLLDVVESLGLNAEEMVQPDKSPKNVHFQSIYDEDKDWLRPGWRRGEKKTKRIELDIVMGRVKTEDFANEVLKLMDKSIPIKDVGRVMIMPKYTTEVKEELEAVMDEVKGQFELLREDIRPEFMGLEKSFLDISLSDCEEEAQDSMNERGKETSDEVIKILEQVIENIKRR